VALSWHKITQQEKNMNTTFTPNLMTKNVNASVEFYSRHLGFNMMMGLPFESETPVEQLSDGTPLQYAMLNKDGAMVMFQHQQSLTEECDVFTDKAVAASGTYYLEVENLDALKSGLGDDIDIVVPERVTFYGMRELWIRDNNGYIITLAQKHSN
jgi:uncharacterized glyoxalase superfamily protein PhnB